MGKQRPMTRTEAVDEANFILTIDPEKPGISFNWDSACFARYCKMQSDHARESGHLKEAEIMEIELDSPREVDYQ